MTIQYYNTNILPIKLPDNTIENGGVSAWQGIRYIAQDTYILCGTTNPNPNAGNGLLFLGNISCTNGFLYYLNVPKEGGGEYYTSVYGPNYDFNSGNFTFVGSFTSEDGNKIKGFCFKGKLNEVELKKLENFSFPSEINIEFDITFLHSNMNNLIVGNSGKNIIDPQKTISYILDQNTMKIRNYIQYPYAGTTTTYGIWYNGGDSYTIVGGYSKKAIEISNIYKNGLSQPIGSGFIADYNARTNRFCNWTSINYCNNENILTHFEGIYGLKCKNLYALNADVVNKSKNVTQGYYLTICRNVKKGKFEVKKWTEIKYPSKEPGITSSNSVANNNVVGLFISPSGNISYQASIL